MADILKIKDKDGNWQGVPAIIGPQGPQGPQGEPGKNGTAMTYEMLTDEQKAELRGPQGIQGPVGPTGPTGPQGEQGIQGIQGETGPQGIQGPQGNTGPAAGFGTVTATVDSNVGTPSVIVTTSGNNTAKNFTFEFKNMKGEQGEQGPQGPAGPTGPQGPAGSITGNLSADNITGTLTITKGGTGATTAAKAASNIVGGITSTLSVSTSGAEGTSYVDPSADYIPVIDSTSGSDTNVAKKMTFANLQKAMGAVPLTLGGTGQTTAALSSYALIKNITSTLSSTTLATDDCIAVMDTDAETGKKITISNLRNYMVPTWAQSASKPTYTASEVGARPSTWTPTASDVGAVPTSRTVNGKALSSNITLSASDVGALASGGTATAATKLATSRTIRTSLSSTSSASFDGTVNITPGVTGTLGVSNGGTGVTTISALKTALGIESSSDINIKTGSYTGNQGKTSYTTQAISVGAAAKFVFVISTSMPPVEYSSSLCNNNFGACTSSNAMQIASSSATQAIYISGNSFYVRNVSETNYDRVLLNYTGKTYIWIAVI